MCEGALAKLPVDVIFFGVDGNCPFLMIIELRMIDSIIRMLLIELAMKKHCQLASNSRVYLVINCLRLWVGLCDLSIL
jgi:hypothetical protein